MKKTLLGFVLVLIGGFGIGYTVRDAIVIEKLSYDDYLELKDVFGPKEREIECEYCDCMAEVVEVRNDMESKFQEALRKRQSPCEKCEACSEVVTYCDCSEDFELGRRAGYAEAVEEELMYGSAKKKVSSYCEVHYCSPRILRSLKN